MAACSAWPVHCAPPTSRRSATASRRESLLTPTVETVGLRKEYGHKVALHGLDLTVQPGEVFGFLGPNGAGKTTTIKILLGLVRPSSGEARLLGMPAGDAEARRRIGYL